MVVGLNLRLHSVDIGCLDVNLSYGSLGRREEKSPCAYRDDGCFHGAFLTWQIDSSVSLYSAIGFTRLDFYGINPPRTELSTQQSEED